MNEHPIEVIKLGHIWVSPGSVQAISPSEYLSNGTNLHLWGSPMVYQVDVPPDEVLRKLGWIEANAVVK